MAGSQNNIPKNIMGGADTCEDEIDLIDYFRVLWKRKYFIFLFAVLPAVVIFLVFTFSPKDYKITYVYDAWVDNESSRALFTGFGSTKPPREEDSSKPEAPPEDTLLDKERKVLLDAFYGSENLAKLAAGLRENGFVEFAQGISRAKIQLDTSSPLLTLSIIGSSEQDLQKIASIVRDNFENVIPLYVVREKLSGAIVGFKAEMAGIKEKDFGLELELEKTEAVSARMKALAPPDASRMPGDIILHMDEMGQNSKYLPLAYQIQAADVNVINIEETIRANQQRYNYYEKLTKLAERLFDEVKTRMSSHYTVQEFHSLLADMVDDYTEKELANYLNACSNRMENMMLMNTPAIVKPGASLVPNGAVKKSVICFAALLLAVLSVAFISEAVRQKQAPTS